MTAYSSYRPLKTELPPRLINHQRGGIREVQASAVRLHGYSQNMFGWESVEKSRRQASCFRAKNESVSLLKADLCVCGMAFGADGKHALWLYRLFKSVPVVMYVDILIFPVIETGPLQSFVIQLKTQRFYQMKPETGVGAETDNIAGIGGDFGFVKYYIQHCGMMQSEPGN